MSSILVQILPDILEALTVLLSATGKRSAVTFETVKPYQKSEKKLDFTRCSAKLSAISLSKVLHQVEGSFTCQRCHSSIVGAREYIFKIWLTRYLEIHMKRLAKMHEKFFQSLLGNTIETYQESRIFKILNEGIDSRYRVTLIIKIRVSSVQFNQQLWFIRYYK